jgi:hypothetical protein
MTRIRRHAFKRGQNGTEETFPSERGEKAMMEGRLVELSSYGKVQLDEEREIDLLKWHLELLINAMDGK